MTEASKERVADSERTDPPGLAANYNGSDHRGNRSGVESNADFIQTVAESPVKPEWNPGKPGFLTRFLMKIAGVDMQLARTMPGDEQRQMKRVGLALLFGAAFQAICFGAALTVGFGFQEWTLAVVLVLCGVMWAFDTKFAAADWAAQGRAFCRAHGLMPNDDWFDQTKRAAAIAIRWTVSLFIASTLATFVLLKLFGPDIERYWAEQHRLQNRPIVEAVTPRYEGTLAELRKRIDASDQRIEALNREHVRLAGVSAASMSDFDRQIADGLDRIKKLEVTRDEALQLASEHRRDVRAEERGIRARAGNTGLAGKGSRYNFHTDMAGDYETVARAREADIGAELTIVTELRRQRADMLVAASAPNRAQLQSVEGRLAEESANRTASGAEYRRLQDGREEWITAHVRENPGYVPMPQGILAKLEALAAIIAGSALIASLAFFTKGVIMILESAGPLAKVAFTAPGLYQMSVALRLHDAVEMEADRRLRWEHWRLMARNRNHEAIDAIHAARRRRSTEARARDALDKIIQKASWMHRGSARSPLA